MQCQVAREALSARIDGEREPVPAARVDEHLETCRDCCAWFVVADEQARKFRIHDARAGHDLARTIMVNAGIEPVGRHHRWGVWLRRFGTRYALIAVGMIQMAVAAAQMGGADFGMLPMGAHQPGSMNGAHLMNETTAWSFALGSGMVLAGAWPVAAAGVLSVLGVFAAVLAWYVVDDSMAGRVTDGRMLSHLPVLVGVILTAAVYRQSRAVGWPTPPAVPVDDDIVLPDNARRGRRRGHLRSSTDSAA